MFIIMQLIISHCLAVSFPADQVRQIRVTGFEAQVVLTAKEGQNLIQVSDGLATKLGDGVLTIDLPKPNQLSGWKQWLFGQGQKVSFEVISPSKPLEVNLYQGGLNVKNWQQDVTIKMLKGKLNLVGGKGQVKIYCQKIDSLIENQVGPIFSDSYSGSSVLRNVSGDANIKLFSGTIQLEKMTGHSEVEVYDGQIRSTNGTGTLEFDLNKGAVNIQSQLGRIEGSNADGILNIQMVNDSDLYISSKAGRVNITTPNGGGMSYLLATQDGDIWVNDVKAKGDGDKLLRGRLNGQQSRGNIVVRGQEVSVNLK